MGRKHRSIAAALLTFAMLLQYGSVESRGARKAGDEQKRFAEQVLRIAQDDFPQLKIEEGDSPLTLKMDKTGKISLTNLFKAVSSDPTSKASEAEIRHFLKSIEELKSARTPEESTWDSVKGRLRPQIFPAEFLKSQKSKNEIVALKLPFSKHLLQGFVIDSENTFQYVTKDHLKTWRTTTANVARTAYGNLEKASEDLDLTAIPAKDRKSNSGKYISLPLEDGYAAARLLLPEFKKKLQVELGEPCFVAIPNRDFLVAWSNDFSHASSFTRQVIKDYRSRHHPLSQTVFKLEGSSLTPASVSQKR